MFNQIRNLKFVSTIMFAVAFLVGGFFVSNNAQAATLNVPLDYPTIQDAVNAAANNDIIIVAAGTYPEKVLISDKTNLTIQGIGDDSLIEPAYDDSGTAGITIKNSSGLTIKDFKIHTSGREMEGIWVYGVNNGGNAITGLIIQNITIQVDGGSAGQSAAGIIGDDASDAVHSDWHITDNRITVAGTGSTPMVLQDVSNSEFSRNTITNSAAGASTIWSSERFDLSSIIFSDNHFSGGAGRQIYFLTDYNQISGGTAIPVEIPVVDTNITEVTFHGNTFSNWGAGALKVGEISTGHISNFNITNNTFEMTADTDLPIAIMSGTPTLTGGNNSSEQNTFNVSGAAKIQKAVNAAFAGDTINLAPGTYTITGQVVIDKNLSIIGADKTTTIIKPDQDTTNIGHADSDAWILVNSDKTFNLSNITLDGVGRLIAIGILSHGHGTIDNNIFTNIEYNPSTNYRGIGIELYGSDMTISNNNFSNIGRIGIFNGNQTNSIISGNTYIGKGVGTWLDYGFEVGRNSTSTISNNIISNNKGLASDGSTSAGILITSYFNPLTPSSATITGNTITDSTDGIAIGYDDTDTSTVVVYKNKFSNNTHSINSTNPTINAINNWWGISSGPATNSIVGNVNFTPWYIDDTMTTTNEDLANAKTNRHYGSGGNGGRVISAIPATPAVLGISSAIPATPATPVGKVLGATKFNFTKFMRNNSRGDEVIELQKLLTTLGYTLTPDGKFGPKTKNAVIKFQIANELKGDGIVGPLTRAVLNK